MNPSRIRFYEAMFHEGREVPEIRAFYEYVMSNGKIIHSRPIQHTIVQKRRHIHTSDPYPKKHRGLFDSLKPAMDTPLSSELSESIVEEHDSSTKSELPENEEQKQEDEEHDSSTKSELSENEEHDSSTKSELPEDEEQKQEDEEQKQEDESNIESMGIEEFQKKIDNLINKKQTREESNE